MNRIIGIAFKECNGDGHYISGWIMQKDRPFPPSLRQRDLLSFNVFVSIRRRNPELDFSDGLRYALRCCHNLHEKFGFKLGTDRSPTIVKEP